MTALPRGRRRRRAPRPRHDRRGHPAVGGRAAAGHGARSSPRGPSAAFAVAVHAGAQTTADTLRRSPRTPRDVGRRRRRGDRPAVLPVRRPTSCTAHFLAAARACDPLPFYVYEFVGAQRLRDPAVGVEHLREDAPNLAGLKVSDTPIDAVRPYLGLGLDVFVGSGAAGARRHGGGRGGQRSGPRGRLPRGGGASSSTNRSEAAHGRPSALREALRGIPFQAALKQILVDRGVLSHPDVRPPLRGLTTDERTRVARAAQVAG